MSKIANAIGIIAVCLVLTACSLFQGTASQRPEPVLLAPTKSMPQVVLKQSLTLTNPQQSNSFIAVLRLAHDKTSMVALTLAGQPFLTQTYDGQNWHSVNFSGRALPEREIFSMMQFALWPKALLQQSYREENGWILTVTDNSRRADYYGHPYFSASSTGDNTLIEHKMGHYQVIIDTFEKEPLQP